MGILNPSTGYKNKPCSGSPNKQHDWGTVEKRDKYGNIYKIAACKNCGKQP